MSALPELLRSRLLVHIIAAWFASESPRAFFTPFCALTRIRCILLFRRNNHEH
jgi:hypothetical protein